MRSEFDERVNALKRRELSRRFHIPKVDAKEWIKKYAKNKTTK